jgi:hypothetical protein
MGFPFIQQRDLTAAPLRRAFSLCQFGTEKALNRSKSFQGYHFPLHRQNRTISNKFNGIRGLLAVCNTVTEQYFRYT